jgi:ABC-2 type transport system ATP-binding protein
VLDLDVEKPMTVADPDRPPTGPDAPIRLRGLTKRYRWGLAVDDVSFDVRRGAVTGFLGPNGAGKTTTLKMLLGLVPPTSGSVSVLGQAYSDLRHPTRRVGVSLESTGAHPGRTGRDHLRTLAPATGADRRRVDELLETVGLADAARQRVGEYSLGMRQRLSLATALLGRPQVLVLDEPGNGLDPIGITWLRGLLRDFADDGGTVLFSSHALAEVQQLVDDVVLLSRGRVVHAGSIGGLLAGDRDLVRVETDDPARLRTVLDGLGLAHQSGPDPDVVLVDSDDAAALGARLYGADLRVRSISQQRSGLEQRFLELVDDGGRPR